MPTKQMDTWSGTFGKEYTDRSSYSPEEHDRSYVDAIGMTRRELNDRFLADMDPSMRILEVGSNIGLQLVTLRDQGFTNLYGIELQPYAVEVCQKTFPGLNVIQGEADNIPFRDGFFDLVFTSGVLIHIPPAQLHAVIGEMVRCSNRYLWGYEYYAEEDAEINYRGHEDLLWKRNFPRHFLEVDPSLTLVKKEVYPRLDVDSQDVGYLLEKGQR